MSAVVLTKETYQSKIRTGVALIDFWAPWCGPCKVQLPIIEELANELKNQVVVAKINVDEEGEIAQHLGITGIPTLILYKDGEIVERWTGLKQKSELKNKILTYLT